MEKAKFIVFEGIDGSGKSTHIKLLKKYLESKGISCYVTFEPTDSPFGALVHQCMTGRIQTDEKTIAALFAADRMDHLFNKHNGIIKKMEEGYTVISDRYYFSSYAYHSVSLPIDWVIEANRLSFEALKPDLNIFIDVDPEVSWQRLQKRSNLERYEKIDNMKKVREKYLQAFDLLKDKENVFIVKSEQEIEKTALNIRAAVDCLYKDR